ncbi:RNF151_1 [Blepharisma stoltei]|uniref:Uncharacterized protein n=1 Tax=Blepharisma stoltei TaxID=1481888 RepID=A0AAU9JUI8_9CILI|nr:unnamed protein product [Blepharisma stoltei]
MGYAIERFVDPVNPELFCSMCREVLKDPLECSSCQSSFCASCTEEWKKKNSVCPNSCNLNFQRAHKFLRQVLGLLKLKCKNSEAGCQIVTTLDLISKHEALECPYTLVQCKYPGCNAQFFRSEAENHDKTCEQKIITCNECGEEFSYKIAEQHSCIHVMVQVVQDIKLLSTQSTKMIKELQESDLITKKNWKLRHENVRCNACQKDPIEGTRNTCLECPDFNLCSTCKAESKHDHRFIQLSENGKHEYVTCDGCFASPIPGIRWKCKVCDNFDFCHRCKFGAPHPNHEFLALAPYFVDAIPLPPDKLGYRPGEIFSRKWTVFNNGVETIKNMTFICIHGETCTENRELSFGNVEIPAKQSRVLKVDQKITLEIPGIYTSLWRLATSDRLSTFGPDFIIQLSIVN